MSVSPLAGRLPEPSSLIDLDRLVERLLRRAARPVGRPSSACRSAPPGTAAAATARTFNEAHVLAISEAVCRYRRSQGIDGPLFLGRDTHCLSEPAFRSILEVLSAHEVDVMIDADDGFTPTPVISHAILDPQPRRRGGDRGRDRRDAVAQPARGRRLQVQPAPRRPGRHRGHVVDRARGERAARRGARRGVARGASTGRRCTATTTSPPTSTTCPPSWTSTRSAPAGCASAWTRWAAPAWRTGRPSPSATGST